MVSADVRWCAMCDDVPCTGVTAAESPSGVVGECEKMKLVNEKMLPLINSLLR